MTRVRTNGVPWDFPWVEKGASKMTTQVTSAADERAKVVAAARDIAKRFDAESLLAGKNGQGEVQSTFAKVASSFFEFAVSIERGDHWSQD